MNVRGGADSARGNRGGLAQFFVEHPGVGWLAMLATLWWGWVSYRALPQQEDPTFPRHDALVVTVFPGASAEQVENWVTRRIERRLREQDAVEELRSESRANVSVIYVLLRPGSEARVAQSWDQIRARLAGVPLPEGCEAPRLDADYQATATLLFALASAEHSYRELERVAESIEASLESLPSVGRIRLFGNVPEEVELRYSASNLVRQGVDLERVAQALAVRNAIVPAGTFREGGREMPVQVTGEFRGLDEIGYTLLGLQTNGTPLLLRDVFAIRRGHPESPAFSVDTLHRRGGGALRPERSVLLAVEMKAGNVIGAFDRAVAEGVARVRLPAGMSLIKVSDQPGATAQRIDQFTECFLEAVAIVVLVCVLLMDGRSALVVAIAIPLTLALTLGGMAVLQIPLQQISIAALIISLGMLVDDPVVAADGINRELAAGTAPAVAAWRGPYRLRRAILFGTLINIGAFLPLALLPGDMGAFIIALPIVVTLALAASRVVSMTFVPLLGRYCLRGQAGFDARAGGRGGGLQPMDRLLRALLPRYRAALEYGFDHPVRVLALAYGLLLASGGLSSFLGQQFFPPAERHQCLIDIQLPPGSAVTRTREVCEVVMASLRREDAIVNASVFCGGTAPNFYYNVLPREPAPHIAQVLINTARAEDVPALVVRLRAELDRVVTNATCLVRQLDQGPALEAPIMIRLHGADLAELRRRADAVAGILREAGGYRITDDLGQPVPVLRADVDQGWAASQGITSMHVARVLAGALMGVRVTDLREDGHAVPMVLRLDPAESDRVERLLELPVRSMAGESLPLGTLAELRQSDEYPVIPHSRGERSVTVKAHARFDDLPSRVLARARAGLDALSARTGQVLEYAGEARELENSRREMQRVMTISLALIACIMVVQFRSVAKSVVVMLTVPLGLAGALVGLAITGASVGFMALLGIVSLAGVIVSHIIVLSDYLEETRAGGMELRRALVQAGLVRLRAVVATVCATVCGLIPLALKGGELWRPLTAVHIFGLSFATVLTLVVLPVWYYLFVARLRWMR